MDFPRLECGFLKYFWIILTGNRYGEIDSFAASDDVLKISKRHCGKTTIGGFMNTAPRLMESDQPRTGVHYLLWSYNCGDGLTMYDPYGHDDYSSSVKLAGDKLGMKVEIVKVDQQETTD